MVVVCHTLFILCHAWTCGTLWGLTLHSPGMWKVQNFHSSKGSVTCGICSPSPLAQHCGVFFLIHISNIIFQTLSFKILDSTKFFNSTHANTLHSPHVVLCSGLSWGFPERGLFFPCTPSLRHKSHMTRRHRACSLLLLLTFAVCSAMKPSSVCTSLPWAVRAGNSEDRRCPYSAGGSRLEVTGLLQNALAWVADNMWGGWTDLGVWRYLLHRWHHPLVWCTCSWDGAQLPCVCMMLGFAEPSSQAVPCCAGVGGSWAVGRRWRGLCLRAGQFVVMAVGNLGHISKACAHMHSIAWAQKILTFMSYTGECQQQNAPSMHHPQKQNVTTFMVGLKNGHVRKNLTQNGEPQRSSQGTQKKKGKTERST